MLRHIFTYPVLLITAGLAYLLMSIIDFQNSNSNSLGGILTAIFIPTTIYLMWLGWILVRSKIKSKARVGKYDSLVYGFAVCLSVALFVIQLISSSLTREIVRYTMFCIMSGFVTSVGLVRYLDKRGFS